MVLDKLIGLVSLILALSVASERFVEIVKGLLPQWLGDQANAAHESYRRAALQFLALAFGCFSAFIAGPIIPDEVLNTKATWQTLLALGFLASGGSGLWNAILGNLEQLKNNLKTPPVPPAAPSVAALVVSDSSGTQPAA